MASAADQVRTAQVKKNRFRPRGRIVRAHEVKTWTTAQAYLEAAKREALRMRTDAARAAEDEKRQGFEEGRREGAEAAARLLMETKASADRHLAAAEGQLVDLAMAVVQRVLGEFDVKDLMLKAVRHALARQRGDQPLSLYVSPEIAGQLRLQIAESFDGESMPPITVEADPKLKVGACRLASEVGFVELGLDAQLQVLHQGLRGGLEQSVHG